MADVTKVQASDGTIYTINDEDDYTKDEIDAMLANKADVGVSYTKAEDDALLAGKASNSDLLNGLALKADKDTTYTKTEVDDLLATKAGVGDSYTKAEDDALLDAKADKTDVDDALLLKADKADTYTKSETDVLLAGKADVGDSYTKAEDDALLADKADSTDVYDKTEVYTKAEVDALIGGLKMFPLLDFANPIDTFNTTTEMNYTVPEDCWMLISTGDAAGTERGFVFINGLKLAISRGGEGGACSPSLLRVAQGDVITTRNCPQAYGGIYFLRERS